jgi:aspartate aminotransferase
MVNGLLAAGLECEMPEGAFYAFPEVRNLSKNSRKVAAMLLDKAHIATIPGVVFGAQGEGHVRFGYAVPKEAIAVGLKALADFMRKAPRAAK